MGQCYGQLSLEERVEIYRLHAGGRSQNQIASALDRAPSTMGLPLQAGAPDGPAKQRGQKPCDGTFPRADRWPTGAPTWSRHHQPRVNLSFHLSSYGPEGLLV